MPQTMISPIFSVGITGGIGSGKSTVAHFFMAHGIPHIDTDVIAHQLTQVGGAAMPAIQACFGVDALDESGAMNRAAMREKVFQNPQAKKQLEAILHPLIRQECRKDALRISQTPAPYLICSVPLLFESGTWRNQVHRVLVVDCDRETQIARVMKRSQLSREQVERIIQNQLPREEKCQLADDVVNGMLALEELKSQVDILHQKYLKAAQIDSACTFEHKKGGVW